MKNDHDVQISVIIVLNNIKKYSQKYRLIVKIYKCVVISIVIHVVFNQFFLKICIISLANPHLNHMIMVRTLRRTGLTDK